MSPSRSMMLPLQLLLLGFMSGSLACHCDRYPWSPWSACTRTCNYGTQSRSRNVQYDDYYWKNSCHQMCSRYDTRGCNQQACPINCVLSEFSRWSDCSPCARKQFRTRSVVRPSQFGGSECSVELTEERPCHPSKDCQLPAVGCRGDFKCDNGRCINSTLTCNKQNDCGDNSDERGCGAPTVVCPSERRPAPGADLVGNGFDFLAEEPRGAVLDNMFMGGSCIIRRPQSTLLYHRVPHNFKTFDIKVGVLEDFSIDPQPVVSEPVVIKKSGQSEQNTRDQDSFHFLFFYGRRSSSSSLTSSKEAFEASKKKDSKFFRVHQLLPISNFTVKDPQDLVLSLPFLQFLHALPLDYNYALYREIFQRFGTHYYSSGKLGGLYDLLYQYSREEIKSSGETEETINGCLSRDTSWTIILYSESSSVTRCTNNRMTEKYQGSFIQASEKSFSMVKGGGAREAGALAWERQGAAPDKTSYKNWAKSVIDNPALVDYQLRPIIDLVRGIPCAVTKRRHLRKALLQYLEEFDTCKCAPCPNNARPVLSGTECKCVCQTGTFGTNCEIRAPDYTSEVVDGYWSCWGPWSSCSASMRRHRTRKCDNPAPLRGGQPCDGPNRQEEPCPLSLFEKKESCDNDDEFTVGWRDELPPGVEGCLRPQRPSHSFLRKSKQYYSFGEDEEFQCFTGFELEGFQFINCQPDGTWSQPRGRCIRRLCVAPEVPENMELYPPKATYRVGESVGFNCNETGLMPMPRGIYRCSRKLTWEPPLPADLRCTDEEPFVPDGQCGPGQKRQRSGCVCVERESCLSQSASLCVLNTNLDVAVSMSLCSFHAGRCHGDPLFYIGEGVCDSVEPTKLEWARFRAKMSPRSSLHVPCDLDSCYDWETCSASKKCQCKAALDCPRTSDQMFCVKLKPMQMIRSMSLCTLAAITCSGREHEILNEGVCQSR
ncbi:PREDICTED: complement component C6 [Poecilia mexicana]|uniref:Complement component 6 n=1 Tax=Poecilia mexicana TaxID=48701 RepID=A0A3B3YQ48_9TELE|nr:PREDICTED: complement component C6 [Poecilia mexicana]